MSAQGKYTMTISGMVNGEKQSVTLQPGDLRKLNEKLKAELAAKKKGKKP